MNIRVDETGMKAVIQEVVFRLDGNVEVSVTLSSHRQRDVNDPSLGKYQPNGLFGVVLRKTRYRVSKFGMRVYETLGHRYSKQFSNAEDAERAFSAAKEEAYEWALQTLNDTKGETLGPEDDR